MKPFNLHIKNRIRVNIYAVSLFNNLCKALFILALDCHKIGKHLFIIFIFTKLQKLIAFGDKIAADKLGDIIREKRI